jgi:hypothetical protein
MVNSSFPSGCGCLKKALPDMKTTLTAALMFLLGSAQNPGSSGLLKMR